MSQFQTIIICESTEKGTDKKLLEKLIQKHDLLKKNKYTIEPKGSIADVKDFLKLTLINQRYITSEETERVLVVVDGDETPKKRFNEIERCFNSNKFEVQQGMNSKLPLSGNKINVGIYLFPDCKNPGCLETLCIKTLKHNNLNSKLNCVAQYMACISSLDCRMTTNNKSKSKIRIFMASPNPDRYVDSIIDHIDFDSAEFEKLKNFIKQAY